MRIRLVLKPMGKKCLKTNLLIINLIELDVRIIYLMWIVLTFVAQKLSKKLRLAELASAYSPSLKQQPGIK
jgi:hypothetical protein